MFLTKAYRIFANTKLYYKTLSGFRGSMRYFGEDQPKVPILVDPNPFGDDLPNSKYLSDFERNKWIFIDKTDLIYRLISNVGSYILIRPRGFGKSLLLDIIENIFTKNEVIRRLKIGEFYEELEYHPVIHFDFSRESKNLEMNIREVLETHASKLRIKIDGFSLAHSLEAVFEEYSKKNQRVCILVDEYDEPLWVNDESQCRANQELIADMLTTIKSLGNYVRFMLVIGGTRIQLSGIFSGPNNLQDFSLNQKYATLLGFTLKEIESHFSKHITALAKANSQTNSEVVQEMMQLYNGYQFSHVKIEGIYNPISVIECFRNKAIKPYWSLTDEGRFSKSLQLYKANRSVIFYIPFAEDAIRAIDKEHISLNQLLWQTGYLTIKEYKNRILELRETNEETKAALRTIKWNLIFTPELPEFSSR